MPRQGCKQCSKRRIKCDQASPACQKCVKRGLRCSGNGVDYRFVESHHLPSRSDGISKPRASRRSSGAPPRGRIWPRQQAQEQNPSTLSCTSHEVAGMATPLSSVSASRTATNDEGEAETVPLVGSNASTGEIDADKNLLLPTFDPWSCLLLEPLKPGIARLLNHFSTHIAPAMVAFDQPTNGYRHLILPIAIQNDLVQRAVCVVSAFHFSSSRGPLNEAAEAGRTAIIARLRSDVGSGGEQAVFNYCTLTTLIVLLVGETITGSSEFAYLFNMLAATLKDGRAILDAPPEARGFLEQQSRMFQLFTPAFINSEAGLSTLCGDLDLYLDWLLSGQAANPSLSTYTTLYKNAIELARDIYLLEMDCNSDKSAIQEQISCLRSMTEQIDDRTPGMHVLVWSYFIAAASSNIEDDRHYFKARLRQIHNRTRMNNIPAAINTLDRIWEQFPFGGWTSRFDQLRPVLAI